MTKTVMTTTPSISRHNLLALAPPAAVAAALPAVTPPWADTKLFQLADEFRDKFTFFLKQDEEEEVSAAHYAYWDVLDKIADTRAHSYAGLAVKAKIVQEYDDPSAMDKFIASLLDDCVRLSGGAA